MPIRSVFYEDRFIILLLFSPFFFHKVVKSCVTKSDGQPDRTKVNSDRIPLKASFVLLPYIIYHHLLQENEEK